MNGIAFTPSFDPQKLANKRIDLDLGVNRRKIDTIYNEQLVRAGFEAMNLHIPAFVSVH